MEHESAPGPYQVPKELFVSTDADIWGCNIIEAANGDRVALVPQSWSMHPEATAQILAAAPELYTALDNLLTWIEDREYERQHAYCGCSFCVAHAVLTKLESRTP